MSACAEKRCLSARGAPTAVYLCIAQCAGCALCTLQSAPAAATYKLRAVLSKVLTCATCKLCNVLCKVLTWAHCKLCSVQLAKCSWCSPVHLAKYTQCSVSFYCGPPPYTCTHSVNNVLTVCSTVCSHAHKCALQADLLSSSFPCAATAGSQIVRYT